MRHWIRTLDRILRGEATRAADLQDGNLRVPVVGLIILIDLLGLSYGACMGLFSLTPGGSGHPMQLLAAMLKVPALFLLTLWVTFPSLYVFNALVGSRLMIQSVLRLLIASLAVMLAVLASIGPIVAFFSFTTTSYEFMILLNVLVFAISGFLGLAFLLQTLRRMSILSVISKPDPTSAPYLLGSGPLGTAGDHVLAPHVRIVFRIWVIVFGLVGGQMAWVLRPFIGRPGQPFAWFRHPYSNFFQAVAAAAMKLFARG
jgi:hypothetical protein